jgi:hypothetical protein
VSGKKQAYHVQVPGFKPQHKKEKEGKKESSRNRFCKTKKCGQEMCVAPCDLEKVAEIEIPILA